MWSHSMRPKAQHCRTGPQGLDNHIKLTNPSANTHNITCKGIALCTWPYFSLPFNQMPLKLVLSVQQSRPSPSRLLSLYHLHQTPSCPSYLQSIPQEQTHPFLEPLMGNNTVSTSAASHANSAPAAPIFMAVPCAMTPTMALLFWHKDFIAKQLWRWLQRCPEFIGVGLNQNSGIWHLDPFNLNDFQEAVDIKPGWRSDNLADGAPQQTERDRANKRHKEIAEVMWVQYQG